MRVSRDKAAENRERIVDTASRLFREKGIDGVGVDAIMSGAGLTHGGFYGHFGSKDDLAAEAVTRALASGVEKQSGCHDAERSGVRVLVRATLRRSPEWLCHRGFGCRYGAPARRRSPRTD
jgi:TetR/AcrR family transcriptional repressor of nem operon